VAKRPRGKADGAVNETQQRKYVLPLFYWIRTLIILQYGTELYDDVPIGRMSFYEIRLPNCILIPWAPPSPRLLIRFSLEGQDIFSIFFFKITNNQCVRAF